MIQTEIYVRPYDEEKVSIYMSVTMSDKEYELLLWFLDDVQEITNIIKGLPDINELGRYLYNNFIGYNRFYRIVHGGLQLNIPENLADYQYVEEIAKYITLKFSEAIVRANDILEIHEHIATLTLPDAVIEKMNKLLYKPRNLKDFKIDFIIEKKQGFNPIEVRQEVTCPDIRIIPLIDYVNDITSMLTIEFNSLDLDIHDKIMTIGRDRQIYIPAKLIHSKEDVEKIIDAVKSEISQKMEDIKNSGIFNLVIASTLYGDRDRLEYINTFRVFTERKISRYFTFDIIIERPRLLDNIRVVLNIRMPFIEEFGGKNRIEVPIEVDTDEGKFLAKLLISSSNQQQSVHIVIPKDIKESRIKRLMEGDFSVVEEIKKVDQKVIEQLTDGVKRQIKEALVENGIVEKNNKGKYVLNEKYKIDKYKNSNDHFDLSTQVSSMDILDLMKEDDKKKLVTYLVSEKIKSSISGD